MAGKYDPVQIVDSRIIDSGRRTGESIVGVWTNKEIRVGNHSIKFDANIKRTEGSPGFDRFDVTKVSIDGKEVKLSPSQKADFERYYKNYEVWEFVKLDGRDISKDPWLAKMGTMMSEHNRFMMLTLLSPEAADRMQMAKEIVKGLQELSKEPPFEKQMAGIMDELRFSKSK